MKSIIVKDLKVCLNCEKTDGFVKIEKHHVIHGTSGRKLSTQYHLIIGLCGECHRGTYGVHGCKGHELDEKLKRIAQRYWERKNGSREDFIRVFGKSYILEDEYPQDEEYIEKRRYIFK